MRRIWILILFLAISRQLSAVSGLVSDSELWAMSNEQSAQGSQPIAHSSTTVVRCLLTTTKTKSVSPTPYIKTISRNIISRKWKPRWSFLNGNGKRDFWERGTGASTGAGNPVPKTHTHPQIPSPNPAPCSALRRTTTTPWVWPSVTTLSEHVSIIWLLWRLWSLL